MLNDAVISPSPIVVVTGLTADATFPEQTDTIEVLRNIDTLCQGRTYQLFNSDKSTAAKFLTLIGSAPGPYTIRAAPTLTNQVGSHTFYLKTTLDAYG